MLDYHGANEVTDLGIAGDPIYVDGIAGISKIGVNFQTTFFCWMKPNGVWLRAVRLNLIRPIDSCIPNGPFASALAVMPDPRRDFCMTH